MQSAKDHPGSDASTGLLLSWQTVAIRNMLAEALMRTLLIEVSHVITTIRCTSWKRI